MDKLTAEKIRQDIDYAHNYHSKLYKEAEKDFEFCLGKQWEQKDLDVLEARGSKGLTINKIQPLIFMVSGVERQGRTNIVCYPEGQEDSVKAEASSKLLQHMVKISDYDFKHSEQFEDVIIGGWGFLEPYIDYTNDIITGELLWKKGSPFQFGWDPNAKEYDLSDARFVYKITDRLTKEDLEDLFPDKKSEIKNLGTDPIELARNPNVGEKSGVGHTNYKDGNEIEDDTLEGKQTYSLIDYYFKKKIKKYALIDKKLGQWKIVEKKEEADAYASQYPETVIKERWEPEVWVAQCVADTVLYEGRAWSFPKWKGYPLIPQFCHKITTPIKDKEYLIQGIVRGLRDPQFEYNKRRTKVLDIINTTANSGWLAPKNSMDKKIVKEFGASPGVLLEYDPNKQPPQKIQPSPTPTSFVNLANEANQDIKEISGINTDLLAMNDKQASGKAIALRQQQGMVMLQRIMDNNRRTKEICSRFMLSVMGDLFTVESAMKVLGDAYIEELFRMPVMEPAVDPMTGQPVIDPTTGEQAQQPMLDPKTGELKTFVDVEGAKKIINEILNDVDSSKYDVNVGEGLNAATSRYANYMMLLELVQQGVQIPMPILLNESMLSEVSKQEIQKYTQQQQQAAMAAAQAQQPPPKK